MELLSLWHFSFIVSIHLHNLLKVVYLIIKENGGSNRIHKYPNQYDDEYQKQQVFQLMIEMGYTFNEEYEIWVKDNVKSIQDGKPYFHFLKYNIA